MPKTEARGVTAYDLDKIIEQGTIADEHPIIQQLVLSRIKEMAGIINARLFDLSRPLVGDP